MAIAVGDLGHIAAHNALVNEHAAWTPFTGIIGGTGSNPSLGTTGTSAGAFIQIGKVVHWRCGLVTGGTGIAVGSGTWLLAFPAPPVASLVGPVGAGWLFNGSFFTIVCDTFNTNYMRFVLTSATGYQGSANQPLSAVGHVQYVGGSYQGA